MPIIINSIKIILFGKVISDFLKYRGGSTAQCVPDVFGSKRYPTQTILFVKLCILEPISPNMCIKYHVLYVLLATRQY